MHSAPRFAMPTGEEVISVEPSSPNPLGDHFAEVVLELAPEGIAVTDEFGRILHANGRFESLFGFSREQLVGHTVEMLLPERARAAHRGHRHDYEQTPTARPMGAGLDLWACHADGTEFPVEVALSPASTSNGMRTIMAVRQVSERRTSDHAALDRIVTGDHERIAIALNDRVIQPVFAATLGLNALLDSATEHQVERLGEVVAALDDAIREIRNVVFAWDRHSQEADIDPVDEAGTPTGALLDVPAHRDPAAAVLPDCSWCGRVHDGSRWLEVEDLGRDRRLLEEATPAITHGICPLCRDLMIAGGRTAGTSTNLQDN
jgi:PAS domain S-box-containing protein